VADFKVHPEALRLRAGVSLSQTRFALSNFCLTHLGAGGQYFVDIIEFCSDAHQLQEVLNAIRNDLSARSPNLLAALSECVREANETDSESSPGVTASKPGAVPRSPPTAPAASPRGSSAPPRPAAPATGQAPRRAEAGALRPGISLAQARFSLTEFCLDELGAKGQQLVDAIGGCADLGALQKVVALIGAEVQANHPASAQRLAACLREINDTAD
jgi:hypothetical protein